MTDRYTDLGFVQDDDGIFDLVVDGGDLAVIDGLESAILVSLFSDRRADESEVGDPRKRRGWIGDLVSGEPQDRHGSGLWLYEQRRLIQETATGVRIEAEQSLDWMVEEKLIEYAAGEVLQIPSSRRINLVVTLHFLDGSDASYAYVLADATRSGTLARL